MTQEIEIEYKNMLTKSEFDRLLASLPFPEEAHTQTNYYFETPDFSLKEHGCALRIREKDGSFTLTLKEPHSTGLLETHNELTRQQADSWLNGKPANANKTADQLADKGIHTDDLLYHGSLTTHRRELTYGDVLLVLDDNTYLGKTDYELELEAPSEKTGQTAMQQLLDEFQIEQRETPNKIHRFFAAKLR
ncbi:CYTH domain-containing protein [Lentibacillus juripiscarius]|uniref:CYTH domain-containing protein n=1 Tax=Lentibacillus juripiscarius TaxID=257446 RepID=A0ABW5V2Y4_9BACI